MTTMELQECTEKLIEALLKVDPEICAIVLFGSAVYAPDLAKDLDVLVISKQPKKSSDFWDATKDFPMPVDVIPAKVGKPLKGPVLWGVRAFGVLLWGDVHAVQEVIRAPVPTFGQARKRFLQADEYMALAQTKTDPDERNGNYRDAFNALFDAARMAVQQFLSTDETRWGTLAQRLPPDLEQRFREIINRLHVDFFYHGGFPPDDPEGEFAHWRQTVAQFIDDLETSKGQTP